MLRIFAVHLTIIGLKSLSVSIGAWSVKADLRSSLGHGKNLVVRVADAFIKADSLFI